MAVSVGSLLRSLVQINAQTLGNWTYTVPGLAGGEVIYGSAQ